MAYENDPDVAAFLGGVKSPAKPVSSDIAPKKSPFSGVNPQLQPDADVNYAQDPDVAAFLTTPVQKVEKKKEFQPGRAALETVLKYKQEAPATAASALDVIAGGITGLVQLPGYALGRAFGLSPEEAQAASGKVPQALAQPFGRATGLAGTPQYQQSFPTKATEKLGELTQEYAVQPLAKKTGASPIDVEQGLAAAGLVAPLAGRGLVKGFQAAAKELPTIRMETVGEKPSGLQSAGAAATPNESMVKAAISQASPELQEAVKNIPVNKVNLPVLQRRIEADTLDVPIRLLEGQATQDPIIISREMLNRAKPGYEKTVELLNEQNQQLIDNLNVRREKAAPDVYGTRPIEFGDSIIDSYKQLNKQLESDISQKYQALRDAAGGQFPVDAPQLLKNIEATLKKELLTNDARQISQFKELQRLAKENSMTFEDFLSLRKNLGNVSRTAQDGNVRMAASRMIDELEKLPLSKEAANLKPLADAARKAARDRFQMLDKDPAFKAAVDDTVPADKFTNKFVVNGINKNIQQMIQNLGADSPAHQNMRAAIIQHLKEKAGIVDDKGNFAQKSYNKALENLDKMNNLNVVMDAESVQKLKSLGNVAAYIQNQPKGSFVNNSNSAVAFLADKAASAMEGMANVVGGGKFGLPVGTMIRSKAQEIKARKEAEKSLRPEAGVELKDIGKE